MFILVEHSYIWKEKFKVSLHLEIGKYMSEIGNDAFLKNQRYSQVYKLIFYFPFCY